MSTWHITVRACTKAFIKPGVLQRLSEDATKIRADVQPGISPSVLQRLHVGIAIYDNSVKLTDHTAYFSHYLIEQQKIVFAIEIGLNSNMTGFLPHAFSDKANHWLVINLSECHADLTQGIMVPAILIRATERDAFPHLGLLASSADIATILARNKF